MMKLIWINNFNENTVKKIRLFKTSLTMVEESKQIYQSWTIFRAELAENIRTQIIKP